MATAQTPFKNRDVISIHNFTKKDILHILKHAQQLKKTPSKLLLAGHIIATCFFEPSTRTRLSFETAIKRLGGDVIGFAESAVSKNTKSETLSDTMRILGTYVDAIVIRHPLDGSARLAAESTNIPVVNGGDGINQHPTQTLLDLYSIQESQDRLDGLSVAIVGDLKHGRTAHSLAQACTHFGTRLYFVSPEGFDMPEYVCDDLRKNGIKFSFHKSLEQVISKIDILYMTRMQNERFASTAAPLAMPEQCVLKPSLLPLMKNNCRIFHPLPRNNEVPHEIDSHPQAYYFQQAENGLYIRQALLALVLGKLK